MYSVKKQSQDEATVKLVDELEKPVSEWVCTGAIVELNGMLVPRG